MADSSGFEFSEVVFVCQYFLTDGTYILPFSCCRSTKIVNYAFECFVLGASASSPGVVPQFSSEAVADDTEALIRFELDIINPESPSRDDHKDCLYVASLNFNSLDFVGAHCAVLCNKKYL